MERSKEVSGKVPGLTAVYEKIADTDPLAFVKDTARDSTGTKVGDLIHSDGELLTVVSIEDDGSVIAVDTNGGQYRYRFAGPAGPRPEGEVCQRCMGTGLAPTPRLRSAGVKCALCLGTGGTGDPGDEEGPYEQHCHDLMVEAEGSEWFQYVDEPVQLPQPLATLCHCDYCKEIRHHGLEAAADHRLAAPGASYFAPGTITWTLAPPKAVFPTGAGLTP